MSLAKIATIASSSVAFLLAVAKVIVGVLSGSVAVVASAVDSILDMFVSIFNMVAVRVSESRADNMFNYGKGKIEGIAALFEGLLIIASSVFILYTAIDRLIHHKEITQLDLAFYVMVFSLVVTFFLVMFLQYVAKKTDSLVIKSDALHYKTDLISNGAIVVVLLIVKLSGYYQIDFIVSILIAIYIFKEASTLVKEGFLNLLDVSLDFQTVEKIKDIIKKEPLVLDFHCLRTRRAGHRNFVDVHLVLTPDMKLKLAHSIIENVANKIRQLDSNKVWVINIHADPYDDSRENKLQEEC
ncbi:MAG: cation transporter [Epsilonproteobacteria bacterium]|nr:cation transporter [Campylobacterota bacterium]